MPGLALGTSGILLPNSVRSVNLLQESASGKLKPFRIHEKKQKKKKKKRRVSREYREHEKQLRGVLTANKVFAEEYLRRHNRSSKRKRDAYLDDIQKNFAWAQRKAQKKLRRTPAIGTGIGTFATLAPSPALLFG
jgi:hypothetical protein